MKRDDKLDYLDGREVSYVKFTIPSKGYKKYKAVIYDTNGKKIKSVLFGDRRYEHYFDRIGMWSELNHNDRKRRAAYRKRHEGVLLKDGTPAYMQPYTPAFFSYHLLW
jgi:hypothetical protein